MPEHLPVLNPNISAREFDRLLEEIESERYGDYKRFGDVAAQALAIAEALGDEERYVKALLYQVWAQQSLNQIERALSGAMEALSLARRFGLQEQEARAAGLLAGAFFLCGLPKEARQLYDIQLNIGKRLGNLELQRLALHDMSLTYTQYEPEPAMELLEQALDIMDGANQRDQYVIYSSVAYRLSLLGRMEESHATLLRAISHADNLGSNALANVYLLAAYISLRGGDMVGSLACIEIAQNIEGISEAQRLNNDVMYINYLYHLGRYEELLVVAERVYRQAFASGIVRDGLRALEMARMAAEALQNDKQLVQVYKWLAEELPRVQERSYALRLQVLAMVFAQHQSSGPSLPMNEKNYALLHRIAHEFRTPLTVIQSSAEMVDAYGDSMATERRQQHLKNITGQVRSLGELLENITVLFDDPVVADPAQNDMTMCLNIVVTGIMERLTQAERPVERIILAPTPPVAIAMMLVAPLQTIAYHLLHNALRYSSADVHFELRVDDWAITMTVTDSGIGIPEAEQQAVFEPLVRGSNQHEPTGGGLGLAIVSKLVNELHASMFLSSAVNYGTTVRVAIPLEPTTEEPHPIQRTGGCASVGGKSSGRQITTT